MRFFKLKNICTSLSFSVLSVFFQSSGVASELEQDANEHKPPSIFKQELDHIQNLHLSPEGVGQTQSVHTKVEEGLQEGGILAALPTELTLHVLSFLSREELARLAFVSKDWRQLSEDRSLWRELQKRDRSVSPPNIKPEELQREWILQGIQYALYTYVNYGPFRVKWSAGPFFSGIGQCSNFAFEKGANNWQLCCTFRRSVGDTNHPEAENIDKLSCSFQPTSLEWKVIPEVNVGDFRSWFESKIQLGGIISYDNSSNNTWRDPSNGIQWIMELELVADSITYNHCHSSKEKSKKFGSFFIKQAGKNVADAPSSESFIRVFSENKQEISGLKEWGDTIVVYCLSAEIALCDFLYYHWRLKD